MKVFLAGLFIFLALLLVDNPLLAETLQWREPVTGMEFVWVPAGSFVMGQTESEKASLIKAMGSERYTRYCADELPRHEVKIDGFWMGKYEVTNAQYLHFDSEHDSKSYKDCLLNGAQQPVVEVSWNDAVAYAKWLSAQSGKQIRLPYEFEWEYACRAGTETMRYWGDNEKLSCEYANVADFTAKQKWPEWSVHDCDDGFAVTSPVGSFKPNSFHLYDMLGNVWEWCNNKYAGSGNEKAAAADHQRLGCSLDCRVARGSCWDNPARYVRAASRNKRKPDFHGYNIGFRLLMVGEIHYSAKQ
jgi:formylglycine-generating enzyme required for sulfatase activity